MENHLYSNDILIRITHSGVLHLELAKMLEYIEILKFSTYVEETDYEIIQSELNQKTFDQRKKGVYKFIDYISNAEESEKKNIVKNIRLFKKYKLDNFSINLKRTIENQIDRVPIKSALM